MYKTVKLLLIFFVIVQTNNTSGQDSLSAAQLKQLTYSFDIENGKLIGNGKSFLTKEISKAQFTMIGEYHESKRISEFTEAIIPVLDSVGCKTLILEVGPISGQILNNIDKRAQSELRSLNEKYLKSGEDGFIHLPIPFFGNVEDATFLEKAKTRKWNILGIDQEYYTSQQMLLDKIFNNLNTEDQFTHKELYKQVSDSISHYHNMDLQGNLDLAISIKNSAILKEFTSKVSTTLNNNEIAEALFKSNHIYWLYSKKQVFESQSIRIRYMKSQLRKQLAQNEFLLSKDKLVIKMGRYHLSKGLSPNSLYEVGNTLNEIAEYYGNTTLNIAFSGRFVLDEGKVVDILDIDSKDHQRLKALIEMGRKEEWVVINLKPMRKEYFYGSDKYKFNDHIDDMIKRYDLLVIPKVETDPTPNYKEE